LFSTACILLLLMLTSQGTGKIQDVQGSPGHRFPHQAALDTFRLVSDFVDNNEACFYCHGTNSQITFEDSLSGQVYDMEMDSSDILQRAEYYGSNHKSFSCLDCHDRRYSTYPHPLNASQEFHFNCIDCHGYDDDYAQYQFEAIEEEYQQSIHHLARPDSFSCWKCHDPHAYDLSIRDSENLAASISYDNEICLRCHGQKEHALIHEWLPNQALHFKTVRCIECHTRINDSILVAHLVLPAENAVQNCRECHSRNSILTATLYKYQSAENRNKYGFINAAIMNEAYVIGANRNYFLNGLSLIIFGLVFVSIFIHIIFRVFRNTKTRIK